MGDENKSNEPRIDKAIEHAEACFWMAVKEIYPEVKTGTVNPLTDQEFQRAMRTAIQGWLCINLPRKSTARCDLTVELRPPKKGERGWMVEAMTAKDALAEILRESEELGWIADHDHDDGLDDDAMHAVTIVLGQGMPPTRGLSTPELMRAQGFVEKTPIPPPDDPERIHEDDVWGEFVDKLPVYRGWRATWEYPGYIRWSHEERPLYVIATPDYHRPGEIALDIQDNYGHSYTLASGPRGYLLWPVGANRTPETYLNVISDALDKLTATSLRTQQALDSLDSHVIPEGDYRGDDIFQDVVEALQNAEEASGPEGQHYLDLMKRVADEAHRRAASYREILAAKKGGK